MSDLLKACIIGNIEEVRSLVESGADIETKNNYYSQTPLLYASQYRHIDIVKLFVAFALIQVLI